MIRSTISQLYSAPVVGLDQPSASCGHRFVRDHRRVLVIAYEVMPKGSALDHQPRGAGDINGADSDEGHTP
jgi:hypothetical protein